MKIPANKIFALVCMLFNLLSIFPSELSAKARGAEVVITRIDNSRSSGELIAVKTDSILILNSDSGKDASIPLNDILTLKLIKKANPLRGAGIGLLAGAAAGFCYGSLFPGDAEPADFYPKAGALMFSGPGVLLGLIAEAGFAKDKIFLIKGRPSHLLEADLKKLRSKARVKDFN